MTHMSQFVLVNQNHTAQPVKSDPEQMSLMNQFFNEYFENTGCHLSLDITKSN